MTSIKFAFAGLAALFLIACGGETDTDVAAKDSPYFKAADAVVTVDGLPIRYRAEGPKDAQPIVMVHGFTSSLETWDSVAAQLSSDYRVIRLDLPGHGLTGPDAQGRYTNADTVEFLSGFLDALDIENPVIAGNSLGGLAAWRLAQKRPDDIFKLVLIAPGGFSINGVTETPVAVPLMVKLYLTKAPEAGVRQASAALLGDPDTLTEARVKTTIDMMKRPGNGDAMVARAGMFTLPDPANDLAAVTAPALIIWGDKDVMVPPAQGQQFIAAMPNAQLMMLENIGHVPQEEAPNLVVGAIREFIETQD